MLILLKIKTYKTHPNYNQAHLERICCTAPGGKFPLTTETLTPAFSNTVPSCKTQVTPPPPLKEELFINIYI